MPEGLSSDRDRNRRTLLCQWRQDDLDFYARIGAYSEVMRYVGSGTMKYTQTEEQKAKLMHRTTGSSGAWVNELSRITLRERVIDFISLLYHDN
jgi:hypothetical protein